MSATCIYCGDAAAFLCIDAPGCAFCRVCAGLGVSSVAPESEEHHRLRPYKCGVCGKRTASTMACMRESCVAKEIA